MDLYSRKVIAWVLSDTLEAKWVVEAVNKAKREGNMDNPRVMHSDCGIQYTCETYRLVFEYINTFYNTARIHSHCGYKSPQEYENDYLGRLETKVRKAG